MTKIYLSSDDDFAKSPFGVMQRNCFDCNRGKGNRDTTDWRADNDEAEEDKVA